VVSLIHGKDLLKRAAGSSDGCILLRLGEAGKGWRGGKANLGDEARKLWCNRAMVKKLKDPSIAQITSFHCGNEAIEDIHIFLDR